MSSDDIFVRATSVRAKARTYGPETQQKILRPKHERPSQVSDVARVGSKEQPRLPRIELPEEATGLFHVDYDRILVDDSLSDKDVILLSIYLLERENKRAGVHYAECKRLFTSLGRRDHPNFTVNVHNAIKERREYEPVGDGY